MHDNLSKPLQILSPFGTPNCLTLTYFSHICFVFRHLSTTVHVIAQWEAASFDPLNPLMASCLFRSVYFVLAIGYKREQTKAAIFDQKCIQFHATSVDCTTETRFRYRGPNSRSSFEQLEIEHRYNLKIYHIWHQIYFRGPFKMEKSTSSYL